MIKVWLLLVASAPCHLTLDQLPGVGELVKQAASCLQYYLAGHNHVGLETDFVPKLLPQAERAREEGRSEKQSERSLEADGMDGVTKATSCFLLL